MTVNMKRLLCLVIALITVLTFSACKDPSGSDIDPDTTSPITDPNLPLKEPQQFSITSSYVLVRPDERNAAEISAIDLLSRGIKSAYGVDITDTTDFLRHNEEVKPYEFEIIVGPTNRQDSLRLYSELSYYDWAYEIVSPNVVAICGGSPEATLTAAEAFLSDVLGYSEYEDKIVSSGNAATLVSGTVKTYRHKYSVETVKIGSRDVSEYTLVAEKNYIPYADGVIDGINRLCGVRLKAVEPSEYAGGPAIFFGMANKYGEHIDLPVFSTQLYYITSSGDDIIIDFKSKSAAAEAAERFSAEYLDDKSRESVTIPLGADTITGIAQSEGTNGLKLNSSSSKTVASGIIYEERLYLDKKGNPVRVYLLTVKNGAAKIETSMPNDASAAGKVSNVNNQLNAAVSNGKNAIAGINADFFDMGGTNVMRGLCVKNGKLIHSADGRPWFGITGDGKAVIEYAENYYTYKDSLANAVGGSNILIKNYEVKEIDIGTDFADTRHPRTAVGIKPNGDIIFMVVDGRQPEISNGASLADLADLLGDLGCIDAINLDGGGSSTFVLKEGDTFNVKNSPSAGALRAVANGLMVILP